MQEFTNIIIYAKQQKNPAKVPIFRILLCTIFANAAFRRTHSDKKRIPTIDSPRKSRLLRPAYSPPSPRFAPQTLRLRLYPPHNHRPHLPTPTGALPLCSTNQQHALFLFPLRQTAPAHPTSQHATFSPYCPTVSEPASPLTAEKSPQKKREAFASLFSSGRYPHFRKFLQNRISAQSFYGTIIPPRSRW